MFDHKQISNLVSIIIPVYNREHLISKAIDSALDQSYKNIEIVIINDGSTDGTIRVLNKYVALHKNIIVIDQCNTGQVIARNNGLTACRGQYIAFLDSDDTWDKFKLEKQIKLFQLDIGLVYCAIHEVDDTGRIIKSVPCNPEVKGNAYHHLLVENRMTGGSVIVTREALEKVGGFDPNLRAGENWELWIRISKSFDINYIDEPLVNYLIHDSNMSQDQSLMIDCIKHIITKSLPEKPTDPILLNSYNLAYARYHYRRGCDLFNRKNYRASRNEFLTTNEYCSGYKDIYTRIFRSFLGKNANMWLGKLKSML